MSYCTTVNPYLHCILTIFITLIGKNTAYDKQATCLNNCVNICVLFKYLCKFCQISLWLLCENKDKKMAGNAEEYLFIAEEHVAYFTLIGWLIDLLIICLKTKLFMIGCLLLMPRLWVFHEISMQCF